MISARSLALVFVLALPFPAAAQDAHSIHLRAHAAHSQIAAADETGETGPGLGVLLGIAVTDRIVLFTDLDMAQAANQPPASIVHLDVGGEYRLRGDDARLVPYVIGALTGSGIAAVRELCDGETCGEYEVTLAGHGVTIGSGLSLGLSRSAGLDVGVRYTAGTLTRAEGDVLATLGDGYHALRLTVGASFEMGL